MANEMTKWGIGPKFTLYSAVYCTFIIVLTARNNPSFRMTFAPYLVLASIGIILILMGIPFYILSLVTVLRAFKEGRLVTQGVYGMCRHPVYAAWVIFFVPGIVLLMNSWIGFSAPVVMYVILRILVKEEDGYLERIFGAEYLAYKEKIPAVLPIGWLR